MPDQHLNEEEQRFLNHVEEELRKVYHETLQSIGDFPEEAHDKINKLKRWQIFMEIFPEKASERYNQLLTEYGIKHGVEASQAIRQWIINLAGKIIQDFEKSLYPAVIIYLCSAAMQNSYF